MHPIVIGGLLWESAHQVEEHIERWRMYQKARSIADATGKPLLNIGCPRRYPFKYPCGDVCLDISEWRLSVCESVKPTIGDVRDIPFPDNYFGSAVCTHVLEHLATIEDAQQAISELQRVTGGNVFIAVPHRSSVFAWLHPEHQLWLDWQADGTLQIEQR